MPNRFAWGAGDVLFLDGTANAGPNCGIAAGGFQPGNTCAKGSGGGSGEGTRVDPTEGGKRIARLPQTEDEAVALATAARDAIIGEDEDSCALDGDCERASWILHAVHPEIEIWHGEYNGYGHNIVKAGDWFIDITSDQFEGGDPIRVWSVEEHEKGVSGNYGEYAGFYRNTSGEKTAERMVKSGAAVVGELNKYKHGSALLQSASQRPESIDDEDVINAGPNCGIAAGGFQPGNTCAKGGGSGGGSDTSDGKGDGDSDASGSGSSRTALPSGEDIAGGKTVKDLKGGGEVRVVEAGGTPYVVKQSARTGDSGKYEVLSSELAETAGVKMPRSRTIELNGKPAVVQDFVKGTSLESANKEGGVREAMKRVPKEDVDKQAMFDYLLGHSDVHNGNYMIESDRLVAIDKEYVLGKGNITGQRFEPPKFLNATRDDGRGILHEFDKASVKDMSEAAKRMAGVLDRKGMKREAKQVRDRGNVLLELAKKDRPTAQDLYDLGSRGVSPPGAGAIGKLKWYLTRG